MKQRLNKGRTKLAVRTVIVGYRSARSTAQEVGGPRGHEIAERAKARAGEILDQLDHEGTNAEDERRTAREELDNH
jgi:hypothetical protein